MGRASDAGLTRPRSQWSMYRCDYNMRAPLFMLLRSVVDYSGSKVEHLVARKAIYFKRNNSDTFDIVLRRILRDKPIPADEFRHVYFTLYKRYGPTDQGLKNRGCLFVDTSSMIGDVRLEDGRIVCTRDREIAKARDVEFARKKYANTDRRQLAFLKSLFELSAMIKKRK